jgi:hypothetical protein
LLTTSAAEARPIRRLFEPTDLELEGAGVAELDLEVGAVKRVDSNRIVVPDAEFDLGLTDQLELDVDGAFTLDSAAGYRVSPDNLWVALKAGLLSFQNASRSRVLSTGIQLGPKLPIARQAQGLGLEGLFLLGLSYPRTHFIANVGGLIDPSVGNASRPCGYEGGLSFDRDLTDTWNISTEIGGVYFFSTDPRQLHTAAGLAWAPSESWTFSGTFMLGMSRGSDPYGVFFGVSPKVHLL